MRNTWSLFRRELAGYFTTPVAYVFIVIFVLVSGWLTFSFSSLYEGGQASLERFFFWHPFLYLFLIPALSMRLWAEERRSGTIELLMTLPITLWQMVVGKFLAAWIFAGAALALTFPTWITVAYLGDPDNGAIVAAYVGSWLMAGGFLAVGSAVSALTKNQVIAFVVSLAVCLVFLLLGLPPVLEAFPDFVPQGLVDAIASLSFYTHFDAISRGVIDVRDVIFFASLIALCLFLNALTLDATKAD
jgi:ABC-2 type transport system permease protein